jgi:hypothetical protein
MEVVMSKIIKCSLAFFLVFICTVSFSFAGNGNGNGTGAFNGEDNGDLDRLRDGSCQDYVVGHGTALLLAGQEYKDQGASTRKTGPESQLRDGSSQDYVVGHGTALLLAGQEYKDQGTSTRKTGPESKLQDKNQS